jgi:hypothetical protein
MLQSWNCQSAACLHFQLFVYIFVSCLFTFLSADCLLWSAVCLQFEFSRQNLGFPSVFCQNNASKLELSVSCLFTFSAVCLHFQLFVYLLFRQLIVYFCQLIVYNLNFHAKIMFSPSVFCQNNASKLEISDVCLHFQLFVYFFVS